MLDLSLKDMNQGWDGQCAGGERWLSRGLRGLSNPFSVLLEWGQAPPNCVPLPSPQIKVMHKQLLLFHNAISAYFAGNQQQLEQTLKQFNIKLKTPGAEKPSWLEEQ